MKGIWNFALSPAYTKSQCVSMVVPPPMAAPCTAATTGLSKSTNAFISRAFSGPWRILQKILDIVPRAEGIAGAMPEHDVCAFVFGRFIEDVRESLVHARSHCVL